MATKMENLQNMQSGLREEIEVIEASALVSINGLLMAFDMPRDVNKESDAAMSAIMLSVGNRVAGELVHGQLRHVYPRLTDQSRFEPV